MSERIAMRPTKDGQFDITSSRFFLTRPTWQRRVVDLIREFYPGKRVDGHPCYISTVVHSLLHMLHVTNPVALEGMVHGC